jgi:hypothetical protein
VLWKCCIGEKDCAEGTDSGVTTPSPLLVLIEGPEHCGDVTLIIRNAKAVQGVVLSWKELNTLRQIKDWRRTAWFSRRVYDVVLKKGSIKLIRMVRDVATEFPFHVFFLSM